MNIEQKAGTIFSQKEERNSEWATRRSDADNPVCPFQPFNRLTFQLPGRAGNRLH